MAIQLDEGSLKAAKLLELVMRLRGDPNDQDAVKQVAEYKRQWQRNVADNPFPMTAHP